MSELASHFERQLGFIINDISRLLRREFDRRVRHLDLTRSQWLILYHLARREGCTQSELADSLQLEKITISRHLDRLERADWIERRDDPRDRRAYHLYLRPKARRILSRLNTVTHRFREDYFQGLTRDRQEALIDDLLYVKRNLTDLLNRS